MLWQPASGLHQPAQHWRRPQTTGGGGGASPTTVTWRSRGNGGGDDTPSVTGVSVGDGSAEVLQVIVYSNYSGTGGSAPTCNVTPNGGSALAATLVEESDRSQNPYIVMFQRVIPSGHTTADIDITLGGNPFNNGSIATFTIPTSTLNSNTKVDSDKNRVASATSISAPDIDSSTDGALIAGAVSQDFGSAITFSGDESYGSVAYDGLDGAARHAGDFINGTGAHTGTQTVTATKAGSAGPMAILVASWR
jgi:hypothetical protein